MVADENVYDYDEFGEDEDFNMDEREEAKFDALIDYLRDKQKEETDETKIHVINPKRFLELKYALAKVTQIIKKTSPDAKIEYDLTDSFYIGHAAITIETDEVSVKDSKQLIEAIKFANDVDIFPLTNGNIRIILGFKNMLNEVK